MRYAYRTVRVPLVIGDPFQRPDVMAVTRELRDDERIVSVYPVTGLAGLTRDTPALEALLETSWHDDEGSIPPPLSSASTRSPGALQ